jgi:hypothetical protein
MILILISLFTQHIDGMILVVVLYVADLIITDCNRIFIHVSKKSLKNIFDMTILGDAALLSWHASFANRRKEFVLNQICFRPSKKVQGGGVQTFFYTF